MGCERKTGVWGLPPTKISSPRYMSGRIAIMRMAGWARRGAGPSATIARRLTDEQYKHTKSARGQSWQASKRPALGIVQPVHARPVHRAADRVHLLHIPVEPFSDRGKSV